MSKQEIDRKFDEIVAFAEVEKFIDTPVKRYSSGMQVRLAFAVAAHLEPEILLVDEVLAVGDIVFQKRCLGKMKDVAKGGRTVLFVSHNMAAVKQLCSFGVLLGSGCIHRIGLVDEVISAYLKTNIYIDAANLAERTDRIGGKVFRFTKVVLKNKAGEAVNNISSGEPAEFWLYYNSPTTELLKNISVAIRIEDVFGQYVFTLATEFTGNDFKRLPPNGLLVCRVSAMQLVAGEYRIFLWCSVSGDTSDQIEDAMKFFVSEADVYGSGKFPVKHKHGLFIVPHTWDQVECSPTEHYSKNVPIT
jgi:lipopolysaccharide transport system ATP-binding protein